MTRSLVAWLLILRISLTAWGRAVWSLVHTSRGLQSGLLCTTLALDPSWILRVKDGDTFVIRNAGLTTFEDVRVCCVDTPERKDPGFDDATAFTDRWLHAGPFTLDVCKRDSFGRLLGTVTRDGHDLADALLEAGLAVPYERKK